MLFNYVIFGFIDNAVMLAGVITGISIEHKFPKKYQTGFAGATIGGGLGNAFSDFLGGLGASSMSLAIGSFTGCIIALALIPLFIKARTRLRVQTINKQFKKV